MLRDLHYASPPATIYFLHLLNHIDLKSIRFRPDVRPVSEMDFYSTNMDRTIMHATCNLYPKILVDSRAFFNRRVVRRYVRVTR